MRRHLASLTLLLGLAACVPGSEAVETARTDLASRASAAIHQDLQAVLARLQDAVRGTPSALAEALPPPAGPFEALQKLRERTGVDGILWEGPGGEQVWAGTTVDPEPRHAPAWRGSFREGDLAFHDGPFLRALVWGPVPAAGGYVTATALLDADAPGTMRAPFAARWLDPLGVAEVRLQPLAEETPPPPDATALLLRDAEGPLLRAVVVPPGADAVAERLERRRGTWIGLLLLALWAGGLFLGVRALGRRAPSPPIWVLAGLLTLLARALLVPLRLPDRFPALAPAFDPTAFGIEDPLGWLASPADFLLTAVAGLLAGSFFFLAIRRARPVSRRLGRTLATAVGVVAAGGVSALWLATVSVAVAQSQTPFFEAPTVIPPLTSALMLLGLVAATSGAWLLVTGALRVARAGARRRRAAGAVAVALAAAAGLLAWLVAPAGLPAWASWLLPLASLPALLQTPRERLAPLPGSVLLIGVLATLLLFPVLWDRVLARGAQGVGATVEDLLRAEATALEATRFELEAVRQDPDVIAALEAAQRGPRPDGLAFQIWLRSFLARPGEHGLVSVLSPDGRRLDAFTLTPLPRGSLPTPTPPAPEEEGAEVRLVPGEGREVRSVVGRTWIRAPDGRRLGSVVFTVPARLDLVFLGPGALGRATGERLAPVGVHLFDLEFAILQQGDVVRTNTPVVSRERMSFGPAALASLTSDDPPLVWQTEDQEGYAVWSPERGAVVAVRRETPSPADTVLALARLVAVAVGLALLVAVTIGLLGLRRFRPRLQHRVFLSYFAFSFIPIVLLGLATAREIRIRHDAHLAERLAADLRQARADFEAMGPQIFDLATDQNLVTWARQGGHDVVLYRNGEVASTSRAGLLQAEILPRRLPPDAYLATEIERRELVHGGGSFAGRPVWTGYAPVLDGAGRVVATVGIPLLYDEDRVEEELAVTGSVLVAAYLFALVLVLVGGIFAARRLMRPLSELAAGTRRVAEGELDVELHVTGRDELGELVDAFNRMTRALRDATDRAIRAERESAWRRMARQVAHEIKNPLTPIRLMIQQMQAEVERDPARANEVIERTAPVVLRQIESLGKIARDFAHFARMPRRSMEEVDLADLARDVVALYAGSRREGVEVSLHVQEPLPPVRWDAEELRRVLVNLVGNAVQSMAQGGRVDVRLRRAGQGSRPGVQVAVQDTGVGIAPEHLARIFEPDFSTKTEGTGLGLALVRRTIDDLGGTIDVASTEGEGTTFTLWVPAAQPDPIPPSP